VSVKLDVESPPDWVEANEGRWDDESYRHVEEGVAARPLKNLTGKHCLSVRSFILRDCLRSFTFVDLLPSEEICVTRTIASSPSLISGIGNNDVQNSRTSC
jgi:hypothetical protein